MKIKTEGISGGKMTKQITVSSLEQLKEYEIVILENLQKGKEVLAQKLLEKNALEAFQMFKFDKCVTEPLSGEPENLIEVINQSMTYIVSLMAVEFLLQKHPEKLFVINWGNIAGYDIESTDGLIIGECFAATSFRSNAKLTADLKRLDKNESAPMKYEFFYDKEFKDSNRAYYEEKYAGIQIVHFDELDLGKMKG